MTLRDFDRGVLYSAAQIVNMFNEPTIAANLVKEAGLNTADCSSFEEYDKVALRTISTEPGINLNLKGL